MPSPLTRQEQMFVAFVLLAFCTGLGVRHWRDSQKLLPLQEEIRIPR